MKRALALIALLAAGAAVLPPFAPAAEPRASLTDIEDEVMCPICGTPLNLAAAPQAERERAFIRRRIARGQTKEEIVDALVREYGPEVLATPESGGFDLAAWLVPAGGLALAALALYLGVRRWRRGPDEPPPDPDELDPAESERLRSDLARYDL
jgi:cytochrome c-type biogenesis protein CcmH